MPFLCVATSHAARNQVRRPRWLPCSAVPAVTETCRSQAAHWGVSRSRASSQALSWPQAGQRNPPGQRFSSSQRAQAASSGNRASNSGSDRGSSAIPSPPTCFGTTYSTAGTRGMSHCLDNAPMEGFFGSLKNELVHRTTFPTREAARRAIFEYVEAFYNRRRRHSGLGFLTPAQAHEQMAGAA